jgi:hypothetical protein
MKASGFNDTVVLSWREPPGGMAAVRVLRKEGDVFPRDPADGTVIFDGPGLACVDYTPKAGVSYRYAAFARDARGNYAHGDVDGARATGSPVVTPDIRLTAAGSPRVGRPFDLVLSAPGDAGRFHFILASLADRPEIFLGDGRFLGIQFDGLVIASLDPSFPYFAGFLGNLNAVGSARATVNLPGAVVPPGLKLYFSAFLLESAAPVGIGKISKTLEVEIR